MTSPEEDGERLFEALRIGRVGEILEGEVDRWWRETSGRLRWRFDFNRWDPSLRWLEDLPWEALRHPSRELFFALDRRCSIVRSLAVTHASAARTACLPLRCVAVASSPRGMAALDLDREQRRIKKAVADQDTLRWDFVTPADPDRIREELLKDRVDILHFMGHGYADTPGELGLVLESEHCETVRLDGRGWAELVGDVHPALVVLNACHTAAQTAEADEPFHGVAHALVQAGVPAVMAMRRPISDLAAIELSRVLYSRLAAGDGVDEALVEARKAVRRKVPTAAEWLTPALFLRGNGSRLVDRRRASPAASEDESPRIEASLDMGSIGGRSNEVIVADVEDKSSSIRANAVVRSVRGENNKLVVVRRKDKR